MAAPFAGARHGAQPAGSGDQSGTGVRAAMLGATTYPSVSQHVPVHRGPHLSPRWNPDSCTFSTKFKGQELVSQSTGALKAQKP